MSRPFSIFKWQITFKNQISNVVIMNEEQTIRRRYAGTQYASIPILQIKNVRKQFGNKVVLNNMSFDIMKGELFGLIGRSGAGKTTLLKTLVGHYTSDAGEIYYKGENITKNKKLIRTVFGFTTQDNCFYEELTPLQNLEYFGRMYDISKKEILKRGEEILKSVELWAYKDTKSKHLSGGQQRRLDLSISLIHNPEILILDEPTTGLDPILRKSMWRLIQKINMSGVTIIMSSHLLEEMEFLCHEVVIMQNGTAILKGRPEALRAAYSINQEVTMETYPGKYKAILDALVKQGIKVIYPHKESNKAIFYTPNAYVAMRVLSEILTEYNERLIDVNIAKPNLNEVFEGLSRAKQQ